MSAILKRLREIADNPQDAALDVFPDGLVYKRGFSRNLRTLLEALDAYHLLEKESVCEAMPGDRK